MNTANSRPPDKPDTPVRNGVIAPGAIVHMVIFSVFSIALLFLTASLYVFVARLSESLPLPDWARSSCRVLLAACGVASVSYTALALAPHRWVWSDLQSPLTLVRSLAAPRNRTWYLRRATAAATGLIAPVTLLGLVTAILPQLIGRPAHPILSIPTGSVGLYTWETGAFFCELDLLLLDDGGSAMRPVGMRHTLLNPLAWRSMGGPVYEDSTRWSTYSRQHAGWSTRLSDHFFRLSGGPGIVPPVTSQWWCDTLVIGRGERHPRFYYTRAQSLSLRRNVAGWTLEDKAGILENGLDDSHIKPGFYLERQSLLFDPHYLATIAPAAGPAPADYILRASVVLDPLGRNEHGHMPWSHRHPSDAGLVVRAHDDWGLQYRFSIRTQRPQVGMWVPIVGAIPSSSFQHSYNTHIRERTELYTLRVICAGPRITCSIFDKGDFKLVYQTIAE